MVLGIWYNQSIQNPRPNTCWFLIMNLVSHGILTFRLTVLRIFLHVNALAFKMENCEYDLISGGESGIAPTVSIFSVAEHLIYSLTCSSNWKAWHILSSHKNKPLLVAIQLQMLISKWFFSFDFIFYIMQIFRDPLWNWILQLVLANCGVGGKRGRDHWAATCFLSFCLWHS